MLETTVCTFDVNVPYDEWVKKFDIDEAPARSAKEKKVQKLLCCGDYVGYYYEPDTVMALLNNWDWDGNAPDVNMQVGEAWYLDVRKPHRALNGGTDDRIHIVVDVVSNQQLRNLL